MMPRIDYLVREKRSFRPIVLLLTVLVTSACFCQSTSTDEARQVSGTWVLKSIYPTQNVEGPGPPQQKKLLGSTIVLNMNSLKACGQSVPITSVKTSQIEPSDFLMNTQARFGEVGIEAPSITEVVIINRESGTCFGAFPLPGQDIYIKSKNEILVYFEGVIYRALRKKE
ncbi:MAG: hypothetical protein WBE38_10790 [Terracidiphilus sp.]